MIEASLRGENCNPDPKIELHKSDVMIEKEIVRCLDENAKSVERSMYERFNEKIERENYTPSPLEKLDLEIWATEEEHKETWRAGKEIGMSPVEIISTPEIVGTKGVEDMEHKIRYTMASLHNSKILPDFREEYRINKIMFIDQKQTGINIGPKEVANAWREEKLRENLELLRTIHIFRKEDGQFPQGKELQRVLAHEIYHYNLSLIDKERLAYHEEEWGKACKAQIEKRGPVSPYAGKYEERGFSKEDVEQDEEFQAEHYSFWAIDSPDLCPEMESFFDKYFTE